MNPLILNAQRIRYQRAVCKEGKGQIWLSARDIFIASSGKAPQTLSSADLSAALGESAVQTVLVREQTSAYRLIMVRVENVLHLLEHLFGDTFKNREFAMDIFKFFNLSQNLSFYDENFRKDGRKVAVKKLEVNPFSAAESVRQATDEVSRKALQYLPDEVVLTRAVEIIKARLKDKREALAKDEQLLTLLAA